MIDSAIINFLEEIKIIQFVAFYKAGNNGVRLPSYQGSTFRGVFGHVFKDVACTCPKGKFGEIIHQENCPYAYIFETRSQSDMNNLLGTEEIPRPFIISPENSNQQYFAPNERFSVRITLFGKSINYIHYFLYVLFHIGNKGFGKGKQQAELRQVFLVNENGDFQNQIYSNHKMEQNFTIINSKNIIQPVKDTSAIRAHFITPTRLKFNGHYTDTPEFHIVLRSAVRRITSLLYYHHDQRILDIDFKKLFKNAEEVKLVQSDVEWYDWERYSNRQKERMKLGGIVGKAIYEGDLEPFIPWLQLAEWTHIGKNTTFGLGKIKVVFE
ncbi:CRISPR system precrRNA processing endoribonuclease RAMP protein Cas6 [Neobacillus fumarioli]|uniref:CRISPR system precrRNA processing endoribonuclease RAMP protein Cas6 n=1 Tax=Neobacillus fumarioli TaxID=105229 RepID=UPI000834183A|nr:CRISPR system precrRNA processing endoribonuclease RAMP protein Cas6 [Neobacillus fumarioli]